jgi:hypothetical protein
MLNGHNVKIVQDKSARAKIYIDGKELEAVQSISYDIGCDRLPSVSVEFTPATLNVDTSEIEGGTE